MNKANKPSLMTKSALLCAIGFQLMVLIGMYALAAMPLWTGTEIKLKTIPVDPRSLFRGNYAQLRYDISRLDSKHFPNSEKLRNGEVVYVLLKPADDDLFDFSAVTLEQPESGVYLRGRIANRYYENKSNYFRIKYGIEAFFAPKVEALALEKELRDGGIAVLMVSADGKARLKDVIGS